jgi:hypothetical protein
VAVSRRVTLQLPPAMAAAFRALGLTGGEIVVDAVAAPAAPHAVSEQADAVAMRLDALVRLGETVIATFRAAGPDGPVAGADLVDELSQRAALLGLLGEDRG